MIDWKNIWNWIYLEIIDQYILWPLWKLGILKDAPVCEVIESWDMDDDEEK